MTLNIYKYVITLNKVRYSKVCISNPTDASIKIKAKSTILAVSIIEFISSGHSINVTL